MSQQTFRVPIKPHLKKFFLKTYDLVEPVAIQENSLLGNQVMAILQDKRSTNDNHNLNGLLTDNVELSLSSEMRKRRPKITKLIRINVFLQWLFRHSLIVFIEAGLKAGVNPYHSCREFLSFYELGNHDYTLDGIHQIWKRHQAERLRNRQGSVLKNTDRRTKRLRPARRT